MRWFGTVATVTDYHEAYSVLDPCYHGYGVTTQAQYYYKN